jgi:hypothetical protein
LQPSNDLSQESPLRLHPLAPVLALDIDGTLGDYHSHFIWFLENVYWPGSYFSLSWSDSIYGEFSEALHLEKPEYRAAKLAYRLGGMKRCLPLFRSDQNWGSLRDTIQRIRASGIQIWICTQRPWLALTSVDPDTQFWLDANVGKVDGLIYGENKYADLVDIVGRDRVLGVVDDLPECLEEAKGLGLRIACRWGGHNNHWINGAGAGTLTFTRIVELPSIVERWKEQSNGE